MTDATITIQNCNNIVGGAISIYADKLNILFGRNGAGKSTIARAISLASQDKPLTDLTPYGLKTGTLPSAGVPFRTVAIFDDDYVSQYVYQPDTLIKDTFNILIRSEKYDEAKRNIDAALSKIRTTITDRPEMVALREHIGVLIGNIEVADGGVKLVKRKGGIKGVLSGKGAYFNPPAELNELRPFFSEDTVPKWAEWRLRGYTEFGSKGRCPYCSLGDTEQTATLNKAFVESFDKASIEYASAISKAIDALKDYLNGEKANELLLLFGAKENVSVLEVQLAKLGAEARYLHDRLTAIVSFNGSSVDRENVVDLQSQLSNMKVNLAACDTYFVSDLTKNEMATINAEIDSLLQQVGVLKGEIAKYNKYVKEKVNARKKDINDFLKIAGFKYTFDVEINGENNARALLKFVVPGNVEPSDVQSPGMHLSWGEKHAFALVLFMFDAISRDAELVILDDPISSFDSNKKYAIINRLFKTGDRGNSLYQRTVLMLTHDFEPVIDYVQVGAGGQDRTAISATYLENINGRLQCTPIQRKDDLMSSVVLLKELAQDGSVDIAARIGCLRKFIEHQQRDPRKDSEAYNVLSSLIHGRTEPSWDLDGTNKLTDEQKSKGLAFIKEYIPDFDYRSILEQCKPAILMERYSEEQSSYVKMLT